MSVIESSLVSATSLATVEGESRSKYLKRLAKAAAKLSDEQFKALPETAQAWQTDAVVALNDGKKVPELPDADPDDVSKRFPEPPTKEKVVKKSKKSKESKEKVTKVEKPEKAKKEKKAAKAVPPAKLKKASKKDTRGGKRSGAGRKPVAESATTRLAAFLLSPKCTSRDDLRAYADAEGISIADSSLGALFHYGSAVARVALAKLAKK